MAVYPFYVKVNSSTRREEVGVGCRSKKGNMTINILQRNRGAIETPYKIVQTTNENTETGELLLVTTVYKNGVVIDSYETNY